MKNVVKLSVVVVWYLFLTPLMTTPTLALKKRVFAPLKTKVVKTSGVSYSQAKLSRATHSVVLTLTNLATVSRVDYVLHYTANGLSQGAIGSAVSGGKSTDSRDLYFGTCSKGVCTPHANITNAKLTVTTTLKSGKIHSKRYLIKKV